MKWTPCNEKLPEIDNKNPKHYIFVNNVNHTAINIWTEFIQRFPPVITNHINDWKYLDESSPAEQLPEGRDEDAIRFAEWANDNYIFNYNLKRWFNHTTGVQGLTTSQLYEEYKNQFIHQAGQQQVK